MALPTLRTLRRDRRLQELLALNARIAFEAAQRCVDVSNPDPLCERLTDRALTIVDAALAYLRRTYKVTDAQAKQLFTDMGKAALDVHLNPDFLTHVTLDMALNLPLPGSARA